MYGFLFDRRSMSLLLAGAALSAVLVFSSGFLLGLWVSLPPEPEAEPQFAALSDRWQLTAAAGPETAAPGSPPPSAAAPSEDETPAAGSQEQPASSPAVETAPAEPLAAPPAATDLPSRRVERATRNDLRTPPAHTVFSVQVGAFVHESSAAAFVEELRGRGWEPYIVETTFPSGRPVITVRLGSYSRLEEALEAAGAFEARENLETTVRWSDFESLPQGPELLASS